MTKKFKEEMMKIIDNLIDKSLLKECSYDEAKTECMKKLKIPDFTAERIIDALKWKENRYFSPIPCVLRRIE